MPVNQTVCGCGRRNNPQTFCHVVKTVFFHFERFTYENEIPNIKPIDQFLLIKEPLKFVPNLCDSLEGLDFIEIFNLHIFCHTEKYSLFIQDSDRFNSIFVID